MIAGMDPVLQPGAYAFVVEDRAELSDAAFAVIREAEGTTLILPASLAPGAPRFRCITLNVHSALDVVGLTAAVSDALAAQEIPANVVAGFHHDHIFVPEETAETALNALKAAQAKAQ